MTKLIFTIEAIAGIFAECFGQHGRNETGGILIGPKDQPRVITDFEPSTAFAERAATTYFQNRQDVDVLNLKLRAFQSKGFDFKGYVHRHPKGMSRLSRGDLATAKEILLSPNYAINNHLIMSIVTQTRKKDFPLYSYGVSLEKKQKIKIKTAEHLILAKKCVLDCACCFTS